MSHQEEMTMLRSSFAAFCGTLLARRLSLVFPVLFMAALLLLSSVPGSFTPDDPKFYRLFQWVPATVQNVLHIPAYALLAFLWRWCLGGWFRPARANVLAFAAALGFALLEESYQSIIPGRYASLTDVFFDGIGALLGIWIFNRLHRRFCEQTSISSCKRPLLP